jgi:hypothetical protein
MKCRKSPLAQTPPKLPIIPGVTVPGEVQINEDCSENEAPVVRQNGEPVKSGEMLSYRSMSGHGHNCHGGCQGSSVSFEA